MENNSLPLIRASSLFHRRKTIFQTLNERMEVLAPRNLMRQLINLCDGTNQYQHIMEKMSSAWDIESLESLINFLHGRGVIVDARSMYGEIWKAIENPSRFPMATSQERVSELVQEAIVRHRSDDQNCFYEPKDDSLAKLLKGRRSVRDFSGELVDFQSIVNMLWSGYGEFQVQKSSHRTSPSAGALYPLIVHIALFERAGGLHPGVYKVCYDQRGRVGFKLLGEDIYRVTRSFIDPRVLTKTHGLIVLSGSLALSGEKYGNRSMLYVPLEAGHVAQNILLKAVEDGVATLEIGGFVEALLAEAVELSEMYRPLTTIAFGKEGKSSGPTNESLQVSWAIPMFDQYRPPFVIASAKVFEKRSWSHGRDASPELALIKAVAEAKEWTACGSIPTLTIASYSELESAIDPELIIKFHSNQYRTKRFPFSPFNKNAECAWTLGCDYMTGEQVHILADHVYFPYFPKTPYYCFSNSSGCAAYPDELVAIQTATLELIERDSFMLAYLNKLACPNVREETLPLVVQRRMAALRSAGFEIWVMDHSLDFAPVAMVFAQSDKLAYTKCASCSSFDLEHAVSHALSEVEASVLSRLQNGKPMAIKPHEVGSPLEHGRLYANRYYYKHADFLFRKSGTIAFQEMGALAAHSWRELVERFSKKNLRLLTVPLHLSDEYGGNGELHIVRSIVPGLIPMTFGYRQEPAGMERIYQVAKEFGGKELFYEELTKFPHPFE